MNVLVTVMHISMVLAYTIISILNDNVYAGTFADSLFRVATSFVFFSGLLDIFVAYMVWFVLEDEKAPILVIRGSSLVACISSHWSFTFIVLNL